MKERVDSYGFVTKEFPSLEKLAKETIQKLRACENWEHAEWLLLDVLKELEKKK